MLEMADEVQETLGRQYGMPDELDEADLEAGKHVFSGIGKQQTLYIWVFLLAAC